ncbi:MAG: BadF/BadG/BcrA/BcrD ATPase family protein [Vulcanococcus sp.]
MTPAPLPPSEPIPPPLIAGFDAGQTHTSCRLASLEANGDWRTLADGEGSGVSHLATPGGEERFQAALRSALEDALHNAGLPVGLTQPAVLAAAVGASGIEAGSSVQQRGTELAAEALGLASTRVAVSGDEVTALRGAFGSGAGVLVISGTGCIALGRDSTGRSCRSGGWGWLLDGAGSALDIGRDGLALSVQMADGRLADTPLRQALWQALGATSAQEVKAAVVAEGFAPAGFARLAPVVDRLADAGDAHASAVLQRSAEALAQMVAAVAQQLDLPAPAVCGVGGALNHLEGLQRAFAAALLQRCPGAQLVPAAGDACDGGLAEAAERAQAALRC